MKKNNIIIVLVLLIIMIILVVINQRNDAKLSNITVSDIDSLINTDDGDEKINWEDYENQEITLSENITITEEGVYDLNGNIKGGSIMVNASGNVKLNLNNVNINSLNGPCIYIEKASDVVINLQGTNYLSDSTSYSVLDEEVNGVIYSSSDITFEGKGKLVIEANYQDGIVGKDDLKIINGNYDITSVDDGIRGKDSVYILNGNFSINSQGDAIKSTNNTDVEKGFILIENGIFNLESNLDCLQAETKLVIENGEFNVKTGGGSANSSTSNSDWGRWPSYFEESSSNNESAKGFKAINNLVINNGIFNFDTSDDALHSNSYVGILTGEFSILSGDDGIHADNELIIDGGNIKITKSYEGLEASKMTINGGSIDINSSDDGINIAGGVDGSPTNRPGANLYNSSTDNILTINNGNIVIDAAGDGIDVNGSAYMNDGMVTVYGPTNSGNGALDYDMVFEVNGGIIVASGSSGMAQSFTNSSKLYQVHIGFGSEISCDDTIEIVNGDSNIINFRSSKTYSSLIIASPKFLKGQEYTIKVNNEIYENFTVSSNETLVGSNQSMFPGAGGNRPNGRPNGRR